LAESVTITMGLKSPAIVGVPESTPAAVNVSPGGKSEYGANWYVYGTVPPEADKATE
jgi:hypothetical protein